MILQMFKKIEERLVHLYHTIHDLSEEEVGARLDALGEGKNLNYKTSIVDLLKLLELPSDFDARETLALDVGLANQEKPYRGDAGQNAELLRAVNRRLAERNIRIPCHA